MGRPSNEETEHERETVCRYNHQEEAHRTQTQPPTEFGRQVQTGSR